MKRLGERIKRKREASHLQLNDLAKKVGISSSALSQIENAKASPSIVTLKSIADNLHTTVGELIGENEAVTNNPLVKFDQKHFVEKNESGASLYLLSNHGNSKQMDAFLIEFQPGSNSKNIMKTHPGQEFCFVLKGELEIQFDERKYTLKEKDSFYFNSNRVHAAYNNSDMTTEIVWVITPPDG
ncbi:helix-turn-helix domain-containing protein [Carboxylicivirga linearis]|uniref:Helix-turn-helix transcriptional regulator n=1 Tax=Carboxylicivirga linearis TaxID=1628157 RepID=A0ABS5JYN4_9BACT|nr:XRE family transcriptional regulator [Carboxylicivirga linearis]MBS2099998.1 helix-turn-helix transcriptional regulator [Carboxylicivirga linearis]